MDGKRVHLFKVGGPADWAANLLNNTVIGDHNVIESVLSTMRLLEHNASVTPAVR